MPGLMVPMNPLCDLKFVANNKKLPIEWKQPQGDPDAGQYNDSMDPPQHNAIPEPMCYFWTQSTNEHHVNSCKDVGSSFKDLAHAMLDGFKSALDLWRVQAKVKDLKVNAVVALGTPGCLDGPSIESNIKNMSLPAASGNEKTWRDAIAKGLSKNFKDWADKVTVPGLPFYPAFAAFPSPMAPPMPNVPFPLIACPSAGMAKMTPAQLKSAMVDAFSHDDDDDDQFAAMADSIGTAVAAAFIAWLPTQMIMNCMGKGPIPSFAPPYVPVGPVVMGDNLPIPGHLAT